MIMYMSHKTALFYSLLKDKERHIIQLMSLFFFCGMYINVEYDIQTEQSKQKVWSCVYFHSHLANKKDFY